MALTLDGSRGRNDRDRNARKVKREKLLDERFLLPIEKLKDSVNPEYDCYVHIKTINGKKKYYVQAYPLDVEDTREFIIKIAKGFYHYLNGPKVLEDEDIVDRDLIQSTNLSSVLLRAEKYPTKHKFSVGDVHHIYVHTDGEREVMTILLFEKYAAQCFYKTNVN